MSTILGLGSYDVCGGGIRSTVLGREEVGEVIRYRLGCLDVILICNIFATNCLTAILTVGLSIA